MKEKFDLRTLEASKHGGKLKADITAAYNHQPAR